MSGIENLVGSILRSIAVTLLLGILALMVASVCNRFVPLGSLDWSDEIIELMLVWMIFIGSAEVWRTNQHFAVEIVPLMTQGTRWEDPYRVFVMLAGLLFIAIFTYKSFELCQRAIDVSPYFSLPRRLWYAAMPISGFLMMLFSVRRLWVALADKLPKLAKEPSSIAR